MPTKDHASVVFHAGELAVQEQAGVREMAARVGASIHSKMPDAARDFLARQPMVFVGYADATAQMWVSVLVGTPGFAHARSAHSVAIDASPRVGDPLATVWSNGTDVGLLAIELSTRRRMRVNGQLETRRDRSMNVAVRQAYANCPKYIQAREWEPVLAAAEAPPAEVIRGTSLTPAQQTWITAADTFFIGTAHPEGGADVSHRGGAPGFVHVTDGTTVTFPDYAGNNMFNTLGNLAVNPRAGLLFVDFESGDTLQITGEARVDWNVARIAEFAGAQRLVDFTIAEVICTRQAIPLHARFLQASPFNPKPVG